MPEQPHSELLNSELGTGLEENLNTFRTILNVPVNQDVVLRRYCCGALQLCAIYIEGMADDRKISSFVLHACKTGEMVSVLPGHDCIRRLAEEYMEIAQCTPENRLKPLITGVLGGMTVVLAEGENEALLMETRGYVHRPVSRTNNESVVMGAQEGFVEHLRANITLVRRYVQSAELITERISVGTGVPTAVALMYLKGVVDEKALNEARRRLGSIRSVSVQGVGGIQQHIEDQPNSLFPQMLQTERPDRAAACLLDGQFVILAENSPYALAAPVTMFHLIHASDDTFMRWQYATFLRLIRVLGLVVSLLLPGLYVALTLHHTHLVPLTLLLSIAETRADVPFTILFEVLLMEFSFYLINEAGTRIPSQIGGSVSIIGALILGQAAVSASIISPILIIIVALTGLGSYVSPSYSLTFPIVLYRLLIVLAGAALGLYGLLAAVAGIAVHLCSIHSFGVPYLAPVTPHFPHNPDILLRLSIRKQRRMMFYADRFSWLRGRKDSA